MVLRFLLRFGGDKRRHLACRDTAVTGHPRRRSGVVPNSQYTCALLLIRGRSFESTRPSELSRTRTHVRNFFSSSASVRTASSIGSSDRCPTGRDVIVSVCRERPSSFARQCYSGRGRMRRAPGLHSTGSFGHSALSARRYTSLMEVVVCHERAHLSPWQR